MAQGRKSAKEHIELEFLILTQIEFQAKANGTKGKLFFTLNWKIELGNLEKMKFLYTFPRIVLRAAPSQRSNFSSFPRFFDKW